MPLELPRSPARPLDYVYEIQLQDLANLDLAHVKIGRTNSMNRRRAERLHNCPSGNPILLRDYPRPRGAATQAELPVARIKPGKKVPFAAMLEDIVHFQLADIAANRLPTGVIMPGQRLGVNRERSPCIDCGHVHEEIFTFYRLPGDQCEHEWKLLVLPVIGSRLGARISSLDARLAKLIMAPWPTYAVHKNAVVQRPSILCDPGGTSLIDDCSGTKATSESAKPHNLFKDVIIVYVAPEIAKMIWRDGMSIEGVWVQLARVYPALAEAIEANEDQFESLSRNKRKKTGGPSSVRVRPTDMWYMEEVRMILPSFRKDEDASGAGEKHS